MTLMKKILIMDSGSFLTYGGAARTSYDTYNYLRRIKGFDVDIFVDLSKIDSRVKTITEEKIGNKTYDIVLMNSIRDVQTVMKSMDTESKRTKFIYTDRGNVLPNYEKSFFRRLLPKMIMRRYLTIKMKKWLTCYVALSAEQAMYARHFFSPKTVIKYIPNWFARSFKKAKGKKGGNYALYVGRLDERQKKVEFLIDGIGRVKELNRDTKDKELLAVVGEGPDMERYKKYVKDWGLEGNIRFYGFVDESKLIRLYNNAKFFVSTSEWEGMAGTFIEAMACGLPLLINEKNNTIVRYNPKRFLITHHHNGYVYNYNNTEDFASKFYALYSGSELRGRLGENAYKDSKHYDMHRNLEKYRKLIEIL